MIENWFSSEMGTHGLLVTDLVPDAVNTSRRLNPTAQLLTHCLSLQSRVSVSFNSGIYIVVDGAPDPNGPVGARPLDYFKNMPGLTGPFALHETTSAVPSGTTFTFLDRRFGFLHAVDQLLLDLSEDRVDSGLLLYANSAIPPYAFALYVRSKSWLEKRRPSCLLEFQGEADELIRRFALHPTKSMAPS